MSQKNAKLINQKEYLKKYLSGDKEKKKKKKEKKQRKSAHVKVKIIDDDDYDANQEEIDEDLLLGGEDAPQIVGEYIEENPDAMRSKWRNIAVKDEPKTEAGENGIKPEPASEKEESSLWGRKASAIKVKQEPELNIKIKQEKRSSSRELSPTRRSPLREHLRSDQSPKWRRRRSDEEKPNKREHNLDQSPPRRGKNYDQSPPRRRRDDQSPPRRKKGDDDDQSPPRKRRDDDQSPPRGTRDDDQSPPRRKKRDDDDQSPPRRRFNAAQSPPRRRKDADQRRRDSDQSPPRKRRDSDQSPPRKRRDSDQSPPRRRQEDYKQHRNRRDSDQSPPRKRRNSHQSPPRRRRSSSRDGRRGSPVRIKKEERKSRWAKEEPARTPSPPPTHKPKGQAQMRTLDGKKAGLQDAQSLKIETDERRREERRMFEQMSSEVSGRDAEVQMRSTGRRGRRARDAAAEDPVERQRKEEHEEKKKQLYDRWGKGLKQLEDQKARHAEMVHEASKPVARYANDEDLERHLREQEHADDPMLEYMRQKRKKREQHSDKPVLPVYEGSYPENRYGIRPGYRWDGVDRSNGYEQRWFDKQNERRAAQDEAYKYSVEDM
ncbi:BUD13 homolog isoform X1 [Drosophila navojoa]|uniref:BUD13 homolog isoform X1 n=1 Tax=Drosophila navojoa TaxID=7232 RepID=UPI0008468991|nr:BUD13 homolog isoform X1 [Drosophila navojoa]